MHSQMPNGYYCEDLIVYGGLNRGCQVTQGFEIFTPDLRHASNAARVDAHNALMQLLSATSDLKQIQFRWKVDSDYSEALLRYQQETDIGPVVRQEDLAHHRLRLSFFRGGLLAPPRDLGGALAAPQVG